MQPSVRRDMSAVSRDREHHHRGQRFSGSPFPAPETRGDYTLPPRGMQVRKTVCGDGARVLGPPRRGCV